jgi:hypothetical protein
VTEQDTAGIVSSTFSIVSCGISNDSCIIERGALGRGIEDVLKYFNSLG